MGRNDNEPQGYTGSDKTIPETDDGLAVGRTDKQSTFEPEEDEKAQPET
ncbi:hypothetical protein GCM10027416_07810 [Okibacterium endophyticum]